MTCWTKTATHVISDYTIRKSVSNDSASFVESLHLTESIQALERQVGTQLFLHQGCHSHAPTDNRIQADSALVNEMSDLVFNATDER